MKNEEEKVIDEIVKEVMDYRQEVEIEEGNARIELRSSSYQGLFENLREKSILDNVMGQKNAIYEILERINKVSKKVKHNLNKRPYVKVHNLKIKPKYFRDVLAEKKRFEVRYNDRNFKVGDIIVLEEINDKGYTGKYVNTEITYILDDVDYCKSGYVILGIKLRLDRGVVV